MLSFNRLTIEDFGPYRGRQELPFTRDRGVYIVYGANGRGKTRLHKAFRYAMYGEILGGNRAEQAHDLVNSEARKQAGYGSFATILDFEHKDKQYRLTRRYDERNQPAELTILERDGTPLSQDEADKELQSIAPHSVSQFFLFDGELLRQYENLLAPDSDEGAALEEAIERVLGIPIVDNARADVAEVSRLAEKQLTAQYAKHSETKLAAQALNEAHEIRARLQAGAGDVARRLEEARDRISEIENELREQQKAERLLGNLDRLRSEESDLDHREQEAVDALSELSADLWKAILTQSATAKLATAETEVQNAEAELQSATAAARDLAHLHNGHDCPVCHRDLSEDLRRQITSNLEAAASDSNHLDLEVRLSQARKKRETLQTLTAGDSRLIIDRDRALRSARVRRGEVRDDISALEQQLSEIGEDKLRALTSERDERHVQIVRDKERLDDTEKKLREQDQAIEEIKRRLRQYSVQADPTIELKDQVSQALVSLFSGAIDAYRAKLRRQVEARASEIFRELASEADYVGLRITDRYGLEIIDTDGEVVRRSAGYEHLVALSLIAALQDSAAVRGPVIMDYPFGRLDTDNTSRVVAALPRMARQVVLLSFDGEFDQNAAHRALSSHLIAEYDLERVTSKHTRIERRRNS